MGVNQQTAVGFFPGALALTGQPSASDTFSIGDITYTFVASPTDPYDVDIGGDVDGSIENLAAAINGEGEAGAFGEGTLPNPYVIAFANTDDDEVDLEARIAGEWVNGLALDGDGSNLTVGEATFGDGAEVAGEGSVGALLEDILGMQPNCQIISNIESFFPVESPPEEEE